MFDAISGMEIEQQQLKQHTEKLPISRCRFLSVDTAINFNPTPRVVCKAVFDAKTPSNSLQQRSVYLPIRYYHLSSYQRPLRRHIIYLARSF